MLIDSAQIEKVLNKVRVAREHLAASWPPQSAAVLSVMDFHWAVEDIYQLKISMFKVSFQAEHMRGKVERYEDGKARILIKAQQTPEFLRFVTVKELCHLMIDEHDDWSNNGIETIKGLLKEWQLVGENGTGHIEPSDPLKSEMLAEIAAIEMMYPREFRENDKASIQAKTTTVAKIALEHDIPGYAVEQALRHHDMLDSCWLSLETSLAAKG